MSIWKRVDGIALVSDVTLQLNGGESFSSRSMMLIERGGLTVGTT